MDGIEIKFKCGHCEQEYSQDTFNFAVTLYGIFFLLGKEFGYAGITCPSCLKTIIHEGKINQIEFLRKNVSSLVNIGNTQYLLNLRYHSSINYFPQNIKQYKDIGLHHWNTQLSDEDLDSLQHSINRYIEEEKLDENLFCTYAFDDKPPMGSFLSIGWFKKDWVEELIQIESENSVRIFPRYVPYISLYDDIEQFCWDNHIYLNYLKDLQEEADSQIKKLEEIAIQNNLDFQDILTSNPDILKQSVVAREKNQFVESTKERDLRIPPDFLSILISEPSPVDLPFVNEPPLNSFWKTIHPFRDQNIPKSLTNFDFAKFKNCRKGLSHKEMVAVVRANYRNIFIQKPIFILSNRFILEYIELTRKIDFSYAAVWQLKEKYLKLLHESIVSDHKKESILIKVPEVERKEVQKAEALFPNVSIKSNDSEINLIKIKIPKYAKINKPIIDILLTGETGTGKDLFARAFHESSGRDDDKFVSVNCGSIPEHLFESQFFGHEKGAFTGANEKRLGYFEQADGGTIFLDEIGELDFNHQKRFLRVFENREIQPVGGKSIKVDVKIVYATNKNLDQMVEDGEFRRDLLHRINKFSFSIPPLRERKDDIPLLVDCFIEEFDQDLKNNPELKPLNVAADCMALIKKYKWEGNVRQLKNVIEEIVVNRNVDENRQDIEPSDLPQHILEPVVSEKIDSKPKKGRKKKPSDEELIRLEKEGWSRKEVAEKFGVVRETVSRWYADIRKQQNQSLKN